MPFLWGIHFYLRITRSSIETYDIKMCLVDGCGAHLSYFDYLYIDKEIRLNYGKILTQI